MEETKRTYQKHKIGGKATVKHFLNTKIKEYSRSKIFQPDNDAIHPLYMNISVKRQNTSAKSLFSIHCTVEEYEKRKNSFYLRYQEYENQRIQFISDKLRPYENDDFKISDLLYVYKMDLQKIPNIINELLYLEIVEVCPEANFGYTVSPFSVLSHFESKYPELKLLKEKFSSDIWKFDFYYDLFLCNSRKVSQYDYNYTNPKIFIERFNIFFEPIHFDLVTGIFQKEFIDYFDSRSLDEEVVANAIIKDLNELYKKHETWITKKIYGSV